MALFGVDFYGASRYGPRVYLDFDASPMLAAPVGAYGELLVTWTTPVGNWSELRLVRNAYGTPVDQDDGVVLVDSMSGPAVVGTREGAVRSFTDTALEGGRFQYYAIWLYVPSVDEWTRAASCIGLPMLDFGYSTRLWELTPNVLRTKSNVLLDADNLELKAFEGLIGYRLDEIRGALETLRDVNNPAKVSGNLLPVMAQQWGQLFEPELGMKQMRSLLRDSVYLYRNKGTTPGIEGFVSAVSGYGAAVRPLLNLILDYNDSSAEESIGSWGQGLVNCTTSRYVADGTIDAAPAALGSAMRAVGVFKQTATAAGAASERTPTAALQAVPVTAGTTYTLSAYARTTGGATAAGVALIWLDVTGAVISTSTGATATPLNDWTVRVTATAAAPAGAVYAAMSRSFTAAAAGNAVYWDAMQLEAGAAATAFEDARLIDIDAIAPRVNEATNPSFEVDTAGWSAGGVAGTLAQSTAQHAPGDGTASMLISWATAAARSSSAYTSVTLAENTTYTISMYAYVPAGSPPVAIQVTGAASAYSTDSGATTGAWVRLSVTVTTTAGGATTVGLVANGSTTAGQTAYLDAVLVEKGPELQPYFDGSTYAAIGDSLWQGAGNESRSHYYPQRRAKNYRLNALLPAYTPMGSSFRLNYAQV